MRATASAGRPCRSTRVTTAASASSSSARRPRRQRRGQPVGPVVGDDDVHAVGEQHPRRVRLGAEHDEHGLATATPQRGDREVEPRHDRRHPRRSAFGPPARVPAPAASTTPATLVIATVEHMIEPSPEQLRTALGVERWVADVSAAHRSPTSRRCSKSPPSPPPRSSSPRSRRPWRTTPRIGERARGASASAEHSRREQASPDADDASPRGTPRRRQRRLRGALRTHLPHPGDRSVARRDPRRTRAAG